MPDGRPPYRQYAGLAFVILTYVGGIIGWSCAVQQVESTPPPNGSAQVQAVSVGATPSAAVSVPTVFDNRPSPRRPVPGWRARDGLRLLSPLVSSHQTLTITNDRADVDARSASVRR